MRKKLNIRDGLRKKSDLVLGREKSGIAWIRANHLGGLKKKKSGCALENFFGSGFG